MTLPDLPEGFVAHDAELVERLRKPWFTHGGADLQLEAADTIDRLRAELAAAKGDRAGIVGETGWLIECPYGEHGGPFWAALTYGPMKHHTFHDHEDWLMCKTESPVRFVKDSNEALRFARKQDAEAFIAKFERFLLLPVATEHVWNEAADAIESGADRKDG